MTTRRSFCSGAAASAAFLVWLQGCGGGENDEMLAPAPAPAPGPAPGPAPAPTPAPAPAPLSCGAVTISANHGHLLTIPQADLDSPLSKTYNIQGTGNHNHTVTLAPSQLQAIKAKGAVMLSSSTDGGHAHTVTVNCA